MKSFFKTLLKKRLWYRCFPMIFAKFLRTPFLQNTSGRLSLNFVILDSWKFRLFWKWNEKQNIICVRIWLNSVGANCNVITKESDGIFLYSIRDVQWCNLLNCLAHLKGLTKADNHWVYREKFTVFICEIGKSLTFLFNLWNFSKEHQN